MENQNKNINLGDVMANIVNKVFVEQLKEENAKLKEAYDKKCDETMFVRNSLTQDISEIHRVNNIESLKNVEEIVALKKEIKELNEREATARQVVGHYMFEEMRWNEKEAIYKKESSHYIEANKKLKKENENKKLKKENEKLKEQIDRILLGDFDEEIAKLKENKAVIDRCKYSGDENFDCPSCYGSYGTDGECICNE